MYGLYKIKYCNLTFLIKHYKYFYSQSMMQKIKKETFQM